MNHEPVDKYFGTPMSDWIARVPNELDVDAVGLWQIIPVGIDSFGLSGEWLDDFTRRCIIALLQRGAVPFRDPSGSSAMEYKGTYRDIADQIINQWKAGRPVADHNGLWFALVP